MVPEQLRQQLQLWSSEASSNPDAALFLAGYAMVLRFAYCAEPGQVVYEFKPLFAEIVRRNLYAEFEQLVSEGGAGLTWFFMQLVRLILGTAKVCQCPGCRELLAGCYLGGVPAVAPAADAGGDSVPTSVEDVGGVPRVRVSDAKDKLLH